MWIPSSLFRINIIESIQYLSLKTGTCLFNELLVRNSKLNRLIYVTKWFNTFNYNSHYNVLPHPMAHGHSNFDMQYTVSWQLLFVIHTVQGTIMDDELRTFLMNRNLAEEQIAKLENENVRHFYSCYIYSIFMCECCCFIQKTSPYTHDQWEWHW